MNNKKIPFATLEDEMEALQKRSEFYHSKIAALRISDWKKHFQEIQNIQLLDNQCQSAIAFCFARRQPAI